MKFFKKINVILLMKTFNLNKMFSILTLLAICSILFRILKQSVTSLMIILQCWECIKDFCYH